MVLAAYHQAYKNKKATEAAIKSFREYNDGPYFLVSDGGDDFSDIANKYNCYYYHSKKRIGITDVDETPRKIFHRGGADGQNKDGMLEWLHRFYLACTISNSNHIIMMEDDVLIRGQISVEDDVEFCGLYNPGNVMWKEMIDYLTEKYGACFEHDWYGIPGGSIFKTKTFIENYDRVTKIFDEEFDYIKYHLYGNIGWVDCWMTVYYYLCGKKYTVNPYFTETTINPNWKTSNHAIVHHVYDHYENFGYHH